MMLLLKSEVENKLILKHVKTRQKILSVENETVSTDIAMDSHLMVQFQYWRMN